MRVAQEIVAPVDVELPAHGLGEVRELVPPVHQIDDARRERGVDGREHRVHARRRVEHDALGPRLVRRRPGDRVLEQVRERTVTEVVQQRRSDRLASAVEA